VSLTAVAITHVKCYKLGLWIWHNLINFHFSFTQMSSIIRLIDMTQNARLIETSGVITCLLFPYCAREIKYFDDQSIYCAFFAIFCAFFTIFCPFFTIFVPFLWIKIKMNNSSNTFIWFINESNELNKNKFWKLKNVFLDGHLFYTCITFISKFNKC
jgi:hypothetical protein